MFKYSKSEVIAIANKNNFIVNNTEKVLRLSSILNYLSTTSYGKYLSLKGGTAINLFLIDLPRLSVDIDFDFSLNYSKDEMLLKREEIRKDIISFMQDEGYALSEKSKFVHTLDSFVFSYNTVSGSKDILKIEINYSNRLHILPIIEDNKSISLGEHVSANRLSDEELIGSKINALIVRTTPRDIYDVYNLLKKGINNIDLVKKIAIFYIILASDKPINFEKILDECLISISKIDYNKLREKLIPVLHKNEKLDIEELKTFVSNKIKNLFILTKEEKEYINKFNLGIFNQELLFNNMINIDLNNHPMIAWELKQ